VRMRMGRKGRRRARTAGNLPDGPGGAQGKRRNGDPAGAVAPLAMIPRPPVEEEARRKGIEIDGDR